MKWLLFVLLSSSSLLAVTLTDEEIKSISREEIIIVVKQLRDLTDQSQVAADNALAALEVSHTDLNNAYLSLTTSQDLLTKAQEDVNKLEEKIKEQAEQIVVANANAEKYKKVNDRRGNILGFITSGLLFMIVTRISSFLPMPYNFIVPGISIPVGYFLARMFL